MLFVLIILLFLFNFSYKKAIILFLIFFLGIFRAQNSILPVSILENLNNSKATLKGQIVSSKNISNQYKRLNFYLDIGLFLTIFCHYTYNYK